MSNVHFLFTSSSKSAGFIMAFGLFLPLLFLLIFPSVSSVNCQFGECTHWDILLVPLLTDKFTQVPLLKAIVRSMLIGCRWYFLDEIRIELFTKNNTLLPIKDPILLPEFDYPNLDKFKFTAQERAEKKGQWQEAVEMAVKKMTEAEEEDEEAEDEEDSKSKSKSSSEEEEGEAPERGHFIFLITDFEQSQSGQDSDFLNKLDEHLAENGIFFRNIRLQFDGHKQTKIIPGGGQSSVQKVDNISSNIIRVSIVEPGIGYDAFTTLRPCPQLTDAEKIREYSYVQHFYYQNWFLQNPRGALIGFGLFICAILCAIAAYFFHIWEQTRARRKDSTKQQPMGGGSEKTAPAGIGGGGGKGGGGQPTNE